MTRSCASPTPPPYPEALLIILFSSQSVLRYIQTLRSRWLEANVGGSGQKGVYDLDNGVAVAIRQDKFSRKSTGEPRCRVQF